MIDHKDTKNGKHYWASNNSGMLLIVLKTSEGEYEVCGDWECGIGENAIEIIEEIKEPKGYEKHKLCYY